MAGPFDDLEPEEPRRPSDALDDPEPGSSPTPRPPTAPVPRPPTTQRRPARPRSRHRRSNEPGASRALARGALRRCPRCGSSGLFGSWFRIRTRCPRCGLRLEREEGGFLGAMTVNYGATAVAFVAMLVVWLAIDLPEVQLLRLTIAAIALTLLFPLLFWPFSKTIWAAVDYLVYRTDPEYASRDAADRASGNGGHP